MAVTAANKLKIIRAMRLIAPEFTSRSDDDLALMIDFAGVQVAESVYGEAYPMAVALLTAHLFTTAVSSAGASSSSSSSSSTGSGAARGPLLSETVGSVSRTYANPGGTSTSSSGTSTSLSNSSYGLAFLELQKSFVITTLTTKGLRSFPGQWPALDFAW